MKKYYVKKSVNPNQEPDIDLSQGQTFVPHHDDDGEYKYLPASYDEIPQQPQLPYGYDFDNSYNAPGYFYGGAYGYSQQPLGKDDRQQLKDEINRLKSKIEIMQQKSELAKEVEFLKKDLQRTARDNAARQQRPLKAADKRQADGREASGKPPEKAMPQKAADDNPQINEARLISLVNSAVNNAVNASINNAVNTAVNSAINTSVSSAVNTALKDIAAEVSRNVLQQLQGQAATVAAPGGIGEAEYHELIGYIDDKIEGLKESLIKRREQDFARQQEILHKFSLAAEKVEPGSIIDTESLYADTILDGISELKQYADKAEKQYSELNSALDIVKTSVSEQGSELAYLRTGLSAAIGEEFFKQYEEINSSVKSLNDGLQSVRVAAEESARAIDGKVETMLSQFRTEYQDAVAAFKAAQMQSAEEQQQKVSELLDKVIPAVEEVNAIAASTSADMGELKKIGEDVLQSSTQNFEEILQSRELFAEGMQKAKSELADILSQDMDKSKEELTVSVSAVFDAVTALSNAAEENRQKLAEEIAASVTKNREIINELKGDIDTLTDTLREKMAENKSEISGEIFKLKNDINVSLYKVKDALDEEIEKINAAVYELPVRDIYPRLGSIEDTLQGFTRYTETNTEELQRVLINLQTLLKHAEDNSDLQSAVLSGNEGLSLQIDTLEQKLSVLPIGGADGNAEELSKKVSAIVKDLSADKQADKRIANELAALRGVVMARLSGPDMPSELSSLYSELQKIRLKIEGIAGQRRDNISQDMRMDEVRGQLGAVESLTEGKYKSQPVSGNKPQK